MMRFNLYPGGRITRLATGAVVGGLLLLGPGCGTTGGNEAGNTTESTCEISDQNWGSVSEAGMDPAVLADALGLEGEDADLADTMVFGPVRCENQISADSIMNDPDSPLVTVEDFYENGDSAECVAVGFSDTVQEPAPDYLSDQILAACPYEITTTS